MDRTSSINRTARFLRIGLYLLPAIGLIMVVRRTLVIAGIIQSVSPGGGPPFDTGFGRHPFITFLHILPGALFMLLTPLLFSSGIRIPSIARKPLFLLFIIAAYIVDLSALAMPFIMLPIGGINEAAASLFYALFFGWGLTKACLYLRRKEETRYREWMIRALSIGLAISTVRPIMALFFAFSGQPPRVFFGTAFWIGFTLHLIIAEAWINHTRK